MSSCPASGVHKCMEYNVVNVGSFAATECSKKCMVQWVPGNVILLYTSCPVVWVIKSTASLNKLGRTEQATMLVWLHVHQQPLHKLDTMARGSTTLRTWAHWAVVSWAQRVSSLRQLMARSKMQMLTQRWCSRALGWLSFYTSTYSPCDMYVYSTWMKLSCCAWLQAYFASGCAISTEIWWTICTALPFWWTIVLLI